MSRRILMMVVVLCAALGFAALAAPPQIERLDKIGDKTIVVTFDKSVRDYSSVELADWKLDSAGTPSPTSSTWDAGTQLELTFAVAVTIGGGLNLTYDRLQAADNSIQDAGGLPLYTVTGAVADVTSPLIISATLTAVNEVTVVFNEATNQGTGTGSWLIFEEPSVTATLTWTDAYEVVVTYSKDVVVGQTLFYDVSKNVANWVADLVGETLPDQYVTIVDGLAPTIVSAEKTGDKTVLVTFDELITGSFEAVDWVIVGNTALSAVFGTNVAGTASTMEITYSNDIATDIDYYKNRGTVDSIVDLAGNPLADSGAIGVGDTISPTIVSAVKTAAKDVTVTFSKPVAGIIEQADWWISEDPTNDVVGTPIAAGAATAEIVFTFTDDVTAGDTLIYLQGAGVADSIKDVPTNPLEDASVTIADGISPTIVSAEKTGDKMVSVTFDELITGSFEVVDWIIVGNTALSAVFGTNVAGTASTLAITYTNDIATDINYFRNRGVVDSIVDLAGNPLADSGAIGVDDMIAPTIVSAVKTAAKDVTVTFSKPVAGIIEQADWWISEDPTNDVVGTPIAAGAATAEIVFTFTDDVTAGDTLIYLQGAGVADSIKDVPTNPLEDASVTISEGVPPTITPPVEITGAKTAKVTFDKVVVGAFEALDWKLHDTMANPIAGVFTDIPATLTVPAHSVLELTFNVSLTAGTDLDYTQAGGLVPDSVKDEAGNAMIDDSVAMAAGPGVVALDVIGVVKSADSEVIVTFNAAVAPHSVLEYEDWTLANLVGQPAAIDGRFIADDLLWLRFAVDVTVGDTLKYDDDVKTLTADSIKDAAANPLVTDIYPIEANTATVTVNDATVAAGLAGVVTISVDMDGAGLGGMQVGPTGAFTFDSTAINVTAVTADSPYYSVLAQSVNNATGTATFALSFAGDAEDAIRNGVVVTVEVVGLVGATGTSVLGLTIDWLKDVNDGGVNGTIQTGLLTIGTPASNAGDGDVNGDGVVDITDARWAAEYAIGIRSLTAAQIAAADVAPPPGVVDITDARWIAESAIGIRTLSLAAGFAQTGLLDTAYVSINDYDELVIEETNAAVTDIQGVIYFDSDDVTVTSIVGINGFQVLAEYINNDAGYVRVALANVGGSFSGGAVLQFNMRRGDLADAVIVLDVLRNNAGSNVPYEAMSVNTPQVLEFGCSPSVVDDVNTTYFSAKATHPVDEIRVYIYNFSGDLVYDSGWGPNDLAWHVDNDAGDTLANGVYYYRMEVKLNGSDTPVLTGVGKVGVYR